MAAKKPVTKKKAPAKKPAKGAFVPAKKGSLPPWLIKKGAKK